MQIHSPNSQMFEGAATRIRICGARSELGVNGLLTGRIALYHMYKHCNNNSTYHSLQFVRTQCLAEKLIQNIPDSLDAMLCIEQKLNVGCQDVFACKPLALCQITSPCMPASHTWSDFQVKDSIFHVCSLSFTLRLHVENSLGCRSLATPVWIHTQGAHSAATVT